MRPTVGHISKWKEPGVSPALLVCSPLITFHAADLGAVKVRPVLRLAGSRVVARNHPALTDTGRRRILSQGGTAIIAFP